MYFDNSGAIIGLKKKEKVFKEIVRKLLNKEELIEEETKFLEKEGLR